MGNKTIDRLIECGIKPSVQRVAILEYLQGRNVHPTVDDVYAGLKGKIPTLSKTTVYNTLRLLSEHKAVQMLTMDEHRVCYDGVTSPHVHFVCRCCGRIYDVMDIRPPMLEGHEDIDGNDADEVQLFYKGICAECKKKEKRA